ncbi:MAG: DUF819 family protein [Hungatella sp.]|nr:DUF819 family protein [Hungatella sp.]
MIQTGFGFLSFVLLFTAVVLVVTNKYPFKFYKFLPPVIMIYIGAMVMFTCGVWEMNESVSNTRADVINNLVPVMIFLMCLRCNLKEIVKLGPRLTLTFFSATFSIALGFILSFLIFRGFFESDTHLAFSAMAAGWMGGTQNFLAVKSALGVSDESMTYTLLMGNINYSMLIMFLVAVGGFAARFNTWTKTDVTPIEKICSRLGESARKEERTTYLDLMLILGMSMTVSAVSQYLSTILPRVGFIDASIWKILLATFIGIGFALTSVGKLRGIDEISNISLYLILILTASNVNLAALINAPVYILAGFVILLIHVGIMLLLAKVFRLDLYTCGIASIANVGGVASAPIIAATYDKNLVSVSVLMSLLGDISGTFIALGMAQLLIKIIS